MLNAKNYYKDCFVFSEACSASKPYRADRIFKAKMILIISSVDEFQSFVEQSPADISLLKFRKLHPLIN